MCKEVSEGVTLVRKCDSPKQVCQLVRRCNGNDHVRECGKVRQLSGGVTVLREV